MVYKFWPYNMAILHMTYILFTALTGKIGVIKMTDKNKEKLFTQAEVDNIVKERLERERKRYNSDNDMVETLQKELVTVRAELQGLKADNEAKATALKAEQVNKTIIQELEKANGINPTELARLFINNTSVDDKGRVIYTDDSGNSVPIGEHIKEWASKSTWAIKDNQKAGSGFGNGLSCSSQSMGNDELRNAFGLK